MPQSKPFWRRPLFPLSRKDGSAGAWALLLLLIAQVFSTTWLLVKLNYQQAEFFTALSNKEESRFWAAVLQYGLIILAAIPLLAAKDYTQV